MDTFSILTLQLAKAYGLFIIAAGLCGLFAPDRWRLVIEDFRSSPALTYLSAALVLGLGIALVMAHNLWTDPLAVLVSMFGWISLIEGALLMAVPDAFLRLAGATVSTHGRTRAWAVLALVFGVALLAAGLLGRATVSV